MRGHPLFKAYLALAAVCFFWGTTYLGIRIALDSFPPFALLSIRYLISGSLMLAAAVWRGATLAQTQARYRPALYDDERRRARPVATLHVQPGVSRPALPQTNRSRSGS